MTFGVGLTSVRASATFWALLTRPAVTALEAGIMNSPGERTVPFCDDVIHLRRDEKGWWYAIARRKKFTKPAPFTPATASWRGPFPVDGEAIKDARHQIVIAVSNQPAPPLR